MPAFSANFMSNRITPEELQDLQSGKEKFRQYSGEDLTVYWSPRRCIHSANCFTKLAQVFNPQKRPWIDVSAASSEEIRRTIDTCPSRALLYLEKTNETGPGAQSNETETASVQVQILENGPLLISGNFILKDARNNPIPVQARVAAICRCGASLKKPFCDGTHRKIEFKG